MRSCAFLRGVNVKGIDIKMADVTSILASGNIIFSSDQPAELLERLMEECMSTHFFYDASLFIRSKEEVCLLEKNNPFDMHDDYNVYAFVGLDGIERILMGEFNHSIPLPGENAEIVHAIFYWRVPKGNTLDSAFGSVLRKKHLKNKMTSRNINTFGKILQNMGES